MILKSIPPLIDITSILKVISISSPEPFPAVVWLLGSGLPGLTGIRRRSEQAGKMQGRFRKIFIERAQVDRLML